MAQLKDSLITGDLRVTGTIYGDVPLDDLVDADDLKAIEALSGTSGILKKIAANTWTLDTNSYTTTSGTVTSVRVQATSPVVSSVNTAQTATLNTTISLADNYGDTKNPYASKTARYVLAAPAAGAGLPAFRALTNADVGLANVENTKLSTWAGSSNITTIGTLSSGTVPWARLSDIPTSFTPASHTHDYLPLSGGTVTGTLVLSKNTDLSGTANNSPALIVGGAATAAHIEVDVNEIQSKTNGTSVAALYINNDGGDVYIGSTTTATSSTAAGLRTPGGFAVGKKTWIGASSGAASTSNTSSQLIISSSDTGAGGNVALELWRGSNASWQLSNEAGDFHIRTNYTTAKQTTYSVDAVKVVYNTGNATFKGSVTASSFSGSGASLTSLNASNLGSGTVPIARIPTGTTSSTVALGNHTHNYAGSSSAGGAATNATTTADTTNALYVVGVASGATSTLKHDTGIIVQNNDIYPSVHNEGVVGTPDKAFQSIISAHQMYVTGHNTNSGYILKDGAAQVFGVRPSTIGTTSVEGVAVLSLGNNIATGTANNSTGKLRLYGSDAQYGDITYNGSTQSIDFIFA